MSKRLCRIVSVGIGVSLVLALMGSFALAAEKELAPYEWGGLSDEEKLEYKTIVIRTCDWSSGGSWMEEETRKKFNQIVDTGDTNSTRQMYSKALFQYLHPKVKIKHIDFSEWGPVENLMAAIAGGTAPSCYQVYLAGGVQRHIEEGLVADITDLVKDWDQTPYLKEKLGELWSLSWKDGRCYSVPAGYYESRATVFRKDWFKEAGIFNEKGEPYPSDNWTWNDMRDIAVKLTDIKKKRWGFCFSPTAMNKDAQKFILAWDYGVFEPFSFCTPDKSGKYTWRVTATPQLIKALQFLRDLRFKYDCMLTGTEMGFHQTYRSEMKAGRAGMLVGYSCSQVLYDMAGQPYLMSPTVPLKDIFGFAPVPVGPHNYNLRSSIPILIPYGFDPTLSKEELKAAFEWFDWYRVGKGMETEFRRIADLVPGAAPGIPPSAVYLIAYKYMSPYKMPEVPGLPSLEEYVPADYRRVRDLQLKIPLFPEPFDYGLKLNRGGALAEELAVYTSLFQALVTNPNTTVEAELAKTADILNKTVFNYKIKDDKEKMKAYVDALTNFYKENYPEFYKSKDFEEQLSYFKVW